MTAPDALELLAEWGEAKDRQAEVWARGEPILEESRSLSAAVMLATERLRHLKPAALRVAAAQSRVRDTVFEAAKAMYFKVQTNPDSVEENCHYVSIERDDSGFDAFWNTLRAALKGEGEAK